MKGDGEPTRLEIFGFGVALLLLTAAWVFIYIEVVFGPLSIWRGF